MSFQLRRGVKKICHSRVGGNPEAYNYLETLDSRSLIGVEDKLHGNDNPDEPGVHFSTFYEVIKI